MSRIQVCFLTSLLFLFTCNGRDQQGYTTTGTVEAYTIDIRTASPGKILYSDMPEGVKISRGHLLSVIDTTDFHLQKQQVHTRLNGISIQLQSLSNKAEQLQIKLNYLNKQHDRLQKLVASDGVAQDKLDELQMERDVTQAQLEDIPVQRQLLVNQQEQLREQLPLLDFRIDEAVIRAPAGGVVLERYVERGERLQPGHLVTTLGLTDTVWVMMYIPEPLLSEITLGEEIAVHLDGRQNALRGTVAWIASEAEFTPKTVYTEDTRTSLTYGIRVQIPNPDGVLKIGMPVTLTYSK